MSEYQYYEFQAIDRPLDEKAMSKLRSLTSRAEVTPTSLVNVYHFGDFRGNPDRLMDQYFDAHLYIANWGSRRLMLRLPASALPLSSVKPYCLPDALTVRASGENVILDLHSNIEDGWEYTEGEGWLTSLIPLRASLLAGDLRCLYLGWLAALDNSHLDNDGEKLSEPPVPPGLKKLSAPLRRFAEFVRLDLDLVQIAAKTSGESALQEPSTEQVAAWIERLPGPEKNSMLMRLLHGEGMFVSAELQRRFVEDEARKRLQRNAKEVQAPPRRTAAELLAARDRLTAEKERRTEARAVKQEARRLQEKAAERARHLDALAGRE
ncbi:MAG TPA: hypothetical protein VFB30_19030, partial [Spirochaetia bacterium]|nr:hypothetical protein [Spirochaetia bacterium]